MLIPECVDNSFKVFSCDGEWERRRRLERGRCDGIGGREGKDEEEEEERKKGRRNGKAKERL